jgi:gamma-glutamyltranspeptidase
VSFGLKMADAIAAPRLHTQVYPKEVEYEGMSENLKDESNTIVV